jgi:hypothetical protein
MPGDLPNTWTVTPNPWTVAAPCPSVAGGRARCVLTPAMAAGGDESVVVVRCPDGRRAGLGIGPPQGGLLHARCYNGGHGQSSRKFAVPCSKALDASCARYDYAAAAGDPLCATRNHRTLRCRWTSSRKHGPVLWNHCTAHVVPLPNLQTPSSRLVQGTSKNEVQALWREPGMNECHRVALPNF